MTAPALRARSAAKDWRSKAGDAKGTGCSTKPQTPVSTLHNAADRDGDGKLGFSDIVAGMGQPRTGHQTKPAPQAKPLATPLEPPKTGSVTKPVLPARRCTTPPTAMAMASSAGVMWFAGAGQAKNWLGDKAASAGKALGAAKDWAADKASAAGKAHNAADRDGDGKLGWGDVVAGAGQAKEFAGNAVNTAGKAWAPPKTGR